MNLKSQEDQIRPSFFFFFFFFFFVKDCIFLFVVFHKYVPPLLARVSLGKPDGNFITRADQTNSDVRWLWKVVCGKPSELHRLLEKVTTVLAQTWKQSVCVGLLASLGALLSVSLLAGLLWVASVFSQCAKKASSWTLLGEMQWSNWVCVEDQSPPASAMVMDIVCTCLPVQLSVARRAPCVHPASTEVDRGTRTAPLTTPRKAFSSLCYRIFLKPGSIQSPVSDM